MTGRAALMLQIATGDPRPINRQIVDGVRRMIASGELAVGAALPSVRGLAQQLTVNPNTVAKAYSELTAEGWLDARAGLGLFVAIPRQRLSHAERSRRLDDAVQRFVGDVIGLDYPAQALLDAVAGELALSLSKKTA
ncbi:GntR family transcriptional regulator [Massilia sp. TWP1-3-3]|uniref:GntR family transcriptional regulator n=1 Tax=Massilia sp. TWP1-3-3 TaxID=2804573 RepID=UPI003CEE7CF2